MNDELQSAPANLDRHYYLEFASAYVRGLKPELREEKPDALIRNGQEAGLRLHRFKRTSVLPRVRRVLGILRSFAPESLLDIGSGRGVFLWPLLDAFPDLSVRALDRAAHRITDLEAVARGGIDRLSPIQGDVTSLPFPDGSFDSATILEVLEHLEKPIQGTREVLRVTNRFVVASVPSKPDDNPEHLHLFNDQSLTAIFHEAAGDLGRNIKVRCEYVLNHIVAIVTIAQ